MLNIDLQIQKLKDKGIYFKSISESEAREILLERTYLFKLFYFRKNFHKAVKIHIDKWIHL